MLPDTSSNLLGRCRSTDECQDLCVFPSATPGINKHSHLDRLTSPNPAKKKQKLNKQGTEKEHTAEGAGCCNCTREGGRSKDLISTWTFNKQRPERQEGQQWTGDKPLPKIEQVAVHKTHILSQWATLKIKQHCKNEKQSANNHNTLTAGAGGQLTDHWPCPKERERGKETSPQ
jgi:hypothetical protein